MAIEKRLRCSSTTPAARNPEDGESNRRRQKGRTCAHPLNFRRIPIEGADVG